MRSRILVIVCSLLSVAAGAAAEQRTLSFDPERTTVSFVLGATMHKVRGALEMSSGQVSYDTETGDAAGAIVLDARSADTGNTKRDRDMHLKVLESEQFGTIELHPRRIEGELPDQGTGSLSVDGVMLLHGSEHELTIPIDVIVDGRSITLSAEFEVPYVAWGLRDPSKFLLKVSKHVTVTVEGRGSLSVE